MSAETLRRAAALMRERGEAATPGPWQNDRSARYGERVVRVCGGAPIAGTGTRADRRHIASWHPAVALAVADWLDDEAFMVESGGRIMGAAAIAVANTYLGENDA